MKKKGVLTHKYRLILVVIFIGLSPCSLLAEDNNQPYECMDRADRQIIKIRSFPDVQYLHTLDGQNVLLNEFYAKSLILFPQCLLYKKFYYWQSEIREVVSNTKNGNIRHLIRSYDNCRSTFCPEMRDPQKTHGDVAEFYDQNGKFMGLSVYMGGGKYCALPYDGYPK
jgi:hypothetical protein